MRPAAINRRPFTLQASQSVGCGLHGGGIYFYRAPAGKTSRQPRARGAGIGGATGQATRDNLTPRESGASVIAESSAAPVRPSARLKKARLRTKN